MKVLAITNLFPDSSRPGFATFNRQQMFHLSALCELRLITPVPWTRRLAMGLRGESPAPPEEFEGRAAIEYPTWYYPPKILRDHYGAFYYNSIYRAVDRAVAASRPDVIYATWAYPDCWAAVRMGRKLGVPVVSRLHGSDINDYMRYPGRKRLILEGLKGSARIISVSVDLKKKLVEEGIDPGSIEVLYNGIDRAIFHQEDRSGARHELGLSGKGKIVLFVGNLNAGKGVDLLIDAAAAAGIEDLTLHILGDGPSMGALRNRAGERNVVFHGRQPFDRIGTWMNAADIFCLPSYDEGMPNVVLESLACGTPVVATDTGGIPEIISEASGMLFRKGDAEDLVLKLSRAFARDWDRGAIVSPAGTWEENAGSLAGILSAAADGSAPSSR